MEEDVAKEELENKKKLHKIAVLKKEYDEIR